MTTVNAQVDLGADDGRRYTGSGGFTNSGAGMLLGWINAATYYQMHIFARWTGISIEGTIDAAYVELYADGTGLGTPELKVYGVDEDNPNAPTSAAEFDADALTSAAVDWDEAWVDNTWEGADVELKAIFQELVDTYTISNAAVMVQIKNDKGEPAEHHRNGADTYETDSATAPKLHIDYGAAANTRRYSLPLMGVG